MTSNVTNERSLGRIALVAAAVTVLVAVLLFTTGCKSAGPSGIDWTGAIHCRDGVCTPTLTMGYTPARPQLEK